MVAARCISVSVATSCAPSQMKISGSAIFATIMVIFSSSMSIIEAGHSVRQLFFSSMHFTRFFNTPDNPISRSTARGGHVDIRRVGKISGCYRNEGGLNILQIVCHVNCVLNVLGGLQSGRPECHWCEPHKPVVVHIDGLDNVSFPMLRLVEIDGHTLFALFTLLRLV